MTERPALEEGPELRTKAFYRSWLRENIRHTDFDTNHHVTNSVTASFFNDGRFYLLKRNISPLIDARSSFVLATIRMDYLAQLVDVEQVEIGTLILRVGVSSLQTGQAIFTSAGCAATAIATTVFFETQNRRSQSISDAVRKALLDA